MNIAIFTESYRPVVNGVSVSIDVFARELRKLSHTVTVFAPDFPGYREKEPDVVRLPSYMTPFQRGYPVGFPIIPGLGHRFDAMEFDLVHTQSPFTLGRVGMRLARRFGLPLVTTNHTVYTEYTHYVPLIPKFVTRRLLAGMMREYCGRCDYVVTPSESMRSLLESLGVRTPIRSVPTGPQVESIVQPSPEFPRQHFGIAADAPLLLYTGRIAREKNMETLVEAFRLIQAESPEARLLIAGSGPHEEPTRALVGRLGLAESVIFAGMLSHEQVSLCYADATAFLFASMTDAQGMVVSEAMMQGLPPVATAALGPTEWIEDGISGFLCPNDPRALADRALMLIRDPELRARIGRAAAEYVQARTAPRCAEMLLEVYREAAALNGLRPASLCG